MPDIKLLETFANPESGRPYVIEHIAEEFTSVCPKTGHPDFGTVTLRYAPARSCVELKALKLYYQSFRCEGIFYEAVTNQIADDLIATLKPRKLTVVGDFAVRGGTAGKVTVEYHAEN